MDVKNEDGGDALKNWFSWYIYLGAHGKIEIENIISFNGPGPLVIRTWFRCSSKVDQMCSDIRLSDYN